MKKVLFVCTGNTCRSPMAEVIMRRMAENAGTQMQVQSAGLYVLPGEPASPHAVQAAKELGLSLEGHHAQALTVGMVEQADAVLCMTQSQAEQIRRVCPEAQKKIWAIKNFAGLGSGDVSDPFGGSILEYRDCAQELELLCGLALDKLENSDRRL